MVIRQQIYIKFTNNINIENYQQIMIIVPHEAKSLFGSNSTMTNQSSYYMGVRKFTASYIVQDRINLGYNVYAVFLFTRNIILSVPR